MLNTRIGRQVGPTLSPEAFAALERIARRRSSNVATVAREAIVDWLRREGHMPPLEDDEALEDEPVAAVS